MKQTWVPQAVNFPLLRRSQEPRSALPFLPFPRRKECRLRGRRGAAAAAAAAAARPGWLQDRPLARVPYMNFTNSPAASVFAAQTRSRPGRRRRKARWLRIAAHLAPATASCMEIEALCTQTPAPEIRKSTRRAIPASGRNAGRNWLGDPVRSMQGRRQRGGRPCGPTQPPVVQPCVCV